MKRQSRGTLCAMKVHKLYKERVLDGLVGLKEFTAKEAELGLLESMVEKERVARARKVILREWLVLLSKREEVVNF